MEHIILQNIKKENNVLYKKKGWKDFKNGKIIKVNHHKVRSKVTYNLKLPKKFNGKTIYQKYFIKKKKDRHR